MSVKVREDPEFKLDSIEKLLTKYEKRKYLVLPVQKLREIIGKKGI